MGALAFLIAERVGLIILLAFILVNIRPFRRLLLDATPANLFKLALIFQPLQLFLIYWGLRSILTIILCAKLFYGTSLLAIQWPMSAFWP